MKRGAMWLMVMLAPACATLHPMWHEAAAIGTFSASAIGGSPVIELRPDHTGVLFTRSIVGEGPRVDASWSFDNGIVTISPVGSPSFSLTLGRRNFTVVLFSPDGKWVYVRQAAEKPNKAPERTTLLVTPRAYARVAPSRVVAHL